MDEIKIGFAITCYDKFEEAKILFEIIRKEFKGEYPISFCCNHQDGKKFAEENKPEVYTQGRDIPLNRPTGKMMFADEKWKKQTGDRAKLRLQALDGVQKSCQGALRLDVDYVIHMHSDAWTLSEEGLIRFIGQLKDRKKMLAVRGDGLEHVDLCKDPATACGHLDDHFFAFNRKYFEENKILDFIPEELFPHKYSIHGMLMMPVTRVLCDVAVTGALPRGPVPVCSSLRTFFPTYTHYYLGFRSCLSEGNL